jgi:hypothetical protein
MDKDLQGHIGIIPDIPDFPETQFPRQYHPGKTLFGKKIHPPG